MQLRRLSFLSPTLGAVLLVCPASFSQDAKSVKAAPAPDTAKSLTLTEAETKERDALEGALRTKQAELNEALWAIVNAECPTDQQCTSALLDSIILQKAYRAQKIYKADIVKLSETAAAWLKRIQNAHDCAGCKIEGNSLVRPQEKTK